MKVFVDANPTTTCYVVIPLDGRKVTIIKELDKKHTNNEAEYLAVMSAMEDLNGDLEIYSDSQLVVNQLNHIWGIKEPRLRELAARVWHLDSHRNISSEHTTYNWVSRKNNLAGKVLG